MDDSRKHISTEKPLLLLGEPSCRILEGKQHHFYRNQHGFWENNMVTVILGRATSKRENNISTETIAPLLKPLLPYLVSNFIPDSRGKTTFLQGNHLFPISEQLHTGSRGKQHFYRNHCSLLETMPPFSEQHCSLLSEQLLEEGNTFLQKPLLPCGGQCIGEEKTILAPHGEQLHTSSGENTFLRRILLLVSEQLSPVLEENTFLQKPLPPSCETASCRFWGNNISETIIPLLHILGKQHSEKVLEEASYQFLEKKTFLQKPLLLLDGQPYPRILRENTFLQKPLLLLSGSHTRF
ncbi:unnamed protein product [Mytilus edulis]|uniref:Uncharacterized protein n=1 Tax=Mytilus edulis TaxID=6550 RepID=A0A8S3SX28_MYTED|nr:unnamed protein product [Mytilus edulis]